MSQQNLRSTPPPGAPLQATGVRRVRHCTALHENLKGHLGGLGAQRDAHPQKMEPSSLAASARCKGQGNVSLQQREETYV